MAKKKGGKKRKLTASNSAHDEIGSSNNIHEPSEKVIKPENELQPTYPSDGNESDVVCLGTPDHNEQPSPSLQNGFVDYEHKLIGVSYCGTDAHVQFATHMRKKWPQQCEKFDQEVWLHYKNNGQCAEVYDWKMQVRDKLFAEFKNCLRVQYTTDNPQENKQKKVFYSIPKVNLWAVGSTVNGCGSYNSDMDLCLCLPDNSLDNPYFTEKTKCLKVLRQVQSALNKRPAMKEIIKRTEVISQAKVPIIKVDLHPPYAELDLDINVNNVAGVYNSHLIHYYSKSVFFQQIPFIYRVDVRFPAICLLVKHWAIINEISDALNGTFNSYSLILMVLHFLQCGVKPAVLPNLQYVMPTLFSTATDLERLELHRELEGMPERPLNKMKIGDLVMGFFVYYRNFDFRTWAISVRSGRKFLRSELETGNSNFYIFIEEPFDLINTARCVREHHNFEAIRKAFRLTSLKLSRHPPELKNIGVNL